MNDQLFTCDLCARALFHSKAALSAHVDEKHANFTPDREDLCRFCNDLKPRLPDVILRESDRWRLYGEKAFDFAMARDAGPERLAQACSARAQLELIARKWKSNAEVYVFGSSVAMGLWDGLSDIDCTVVDVGAMDNGEWPPNEKVAVRSLSAIFRGIGFSYQNLEAIEHARVPIIKHNATIPAIKILGEKYEGILSRTVRCLFESPQSPEERVKFENLFSPKETPLSPEALWWDMGYRSCGITLRTPEAAVQFMLDSAAHKNVTVAPIHSEFRPALYHVDFDLSFRTFGIRNSHLLRSFLAAHPCARPGSIVLKDWSKMCGVNNSINGFLTSYAINIMWIYFLYRKGHVPYVDPQSISTSLRESGQPKDPQYVPLLPPTLDSSSETRLHAEMGRLLFDFFAFYVFEFDWENHVVSLNRPGVTTKTELGWTESDEIRLSKRNTRYAMCIEDPYEENLNLGRHLGECRSRKVMTELQRGVFSMLSYAPEHPSACLCYDAKKRSRTTTPNLSDVTRLLAVAATIPSDVPMLVKDFRRTLETSASDALERVVEHWEWDEIVRRLGYKQVAGHVFPVRTLLTTRRSFAQKEQSSQSANQSQPASTDLTQRLIDEFVTEQAKQNPSVVPDWVLMHPSRIPLPPPSGGRIVKSCGLGAPTFDPRSLFRRFARVIV